MSAWISESTSLAGLDALEDHQKGFPHAPADEDREDEAVDIVIGGKVFEHGSVPQLLLPTRQACHRKDACQACAKGISITRIVP
ncbi:protein of unknown function (plasmid) [Cupriavidus taiwanensis]|uniref:Uncharacterized protein n=1 Tax=Cupriavidus taiwanensis TaxID=164546 RepID=A0A375EFM5_9BURK|nr:hypothetical protein CBM2614_U10071 [Cupriavidus taiwanensis]SOZ75151.1 hypothetical protein CBM2613_U10053 [Cupriavidus taiwanensis]SPA11644.1 protein of unknown function [Cupriavidus taiwanensis]SPA57546.1 protein of unknown function [Cupriavidus taiwanensis]SPD49380.1 protein of unknown function [Cupriavidus taiwanensis]